MNRHPAGRGAAGPAGPAQGNSTEGKKMKSKFSVLGLALVAALAFGALAAQGAIAANTHHITAAKEWTPTASAATVQEFRSTTDIAKGYKCNKVSASVTNNVPTTEDEITVTPSYEECTAFEGESTIANVFVETGECDYLFKSTTTEGNPTGGSHANVEIKNRVNPEEPCHIEVKATAFKFKCASIPNQVVEHAVRYEQGTEDIVIKATAHGIENKTTNSIACPTESGGTEVHNDGSYVGDVTLKAHDSNAEPVALTLNENVT
jgi:hypothetical protein